MQVMPQLIGLLKQAKSGLPVKNVCGQGGFKEPTFYIWRAKYGGIEALKGDLGVRRASATGQAQGLRQDARSPSAQPAVLWDCRAMPGAYVTRILDQAARFKG